MTHSKCHVNARGFAPKRQGEDVASKRDELLDAAEDRIRLGGYHAVSFRDLADDLGIKSASVHYYFRHKEGLVLAVVERYAARFFDALARESEAATLPIEHMTAFCRIYRQTLECSEKACLCGVLGAEGQGLPRDLMQAVAQFFTANIDWVAKALGRSMPPRARQRRASKIVAALQGGMMLASTMGNIGILDDVIAEILNDLRQPG